MMRSKKNEDERKEKINKKYAKLFEGKESKFKTALDAKRAGGKKGLELSEKELKEWNTTKSDEVQHGISLINIKIIKK